MTAQPGLDGHLDLDGLCDVLAGEGGQEQRGHLAACPRCTEALADLERAQGPVRAALAALAPPEVPADLAARLDAALLRAREHELAGPRLVVPLPRAGGRTPSWLLGSAAAVVAVAAVAVLGVGLVRALSGGGGSSSTSSGVAAAAASAPPASSSTGTDYGGPTALAAALPALLHGGASAPSAAALAGAPADALARLRTPAGLADCLAGLVDPAAPRPPVALDYARYAGAPALVVVLPAARPDRVDVVVVGADCTAADADARLHAELPRS